MRLGRHRARRVVDVDGDRDAGVPENLGDDGDGHAVAQHEDAAETRRVCSPTPLSPALPAAVVRACSALRGSQGSPMSVTNTKPVSCHTCRAARRLCAVRSRTRSRTARVGVEIGTVLRDLPNSLPMMWVRVRPAYGRTTGTWLAEGFRLRKAPVVGRSRVGGTPSGTWRPRMSGSPTSRRRGLRYASSSSRAALVRVVQLEVVRLGSRCGCLIKTARGSTYGTTRRLPRVDSRHSTSSGVGIRFAPPQLSARLLVDVGEAVLGGELADGDGAAGVPGHVRVVEEGPNCAPGNSIESVPGGSASPKAARIASVRVMPGERPSAVTPCGRRSRARVCAKRLMAVIARS